MEESYRAYYKSAFDAAAIHPSDAAQEASRVRAAICALLGLCPLPMDNRPSSDSGNRPAATSKSSALITRNTLVGAQDAHGEGEDQQDHGDHGVENQVKEHRSFRPINPRPYRGLRLELAMAMWSMAKKSSTAFE